MKLLNVIMLLMPRAFLAQAVSMIVALGISILFQEPVVTIAIATLCSFSMGVATGRDLSR